MKYHKAAIADRIWISNEQFFNTHDLEGEVWKEFESVRGTVLSCKHEVSNKGRIRRITGELNRGTITDDGYHAMHFSVPNSYGIEARVHIIVLTAFQGPPPADMINPTVQHINHNKLDNRIENLCWMSAFDNNQEGHATRIKLVDDSGEHIFASQKVASNYIGRYEDYISECIRAGYKITRSSDKKEIQVYLETDPNIWRLHERRIPRNRNKCKLVTLDACIEFESFQACDRYINKPLGYTTTTIANSWPLLNVKHQFYLFDIDSNKYELYCPTRRKCKNHANKCQITQNNQFITFNSIAEAARYIGRDSEYLRIKIKQHKPIQDCKGNVVEATLIEDT